VIRLGWQSLLPCDEYEKKLLHFLALFVRRQQRAWRRFLAALLVHNVTVPTPFPPFPLLDQCNITSSSSVHKTMSYSQKISVLLVANGEKVGMGRNFFLTMSCNITQQLTKNKLAHQIVPIHMRTKVNIPQHNRLDANSFFRKYLEGN